MKPFRQLHLPGLWLSLLGLTLATGLARAFPPAPHHELYGLVRNQWGEPLDVSGATVFVQSGGRDGVRAAVVPTTTPGVNYRLRVPMDSLTRPDLYQVSALSRTQQFTLRVQIGQTSYLPLEMVTSTLALGQPAQSTRIDLTLGEDTDGDGLPDAWEEAIIAVFGGTLQSITPNGDADGDGISNLDEYRAGTLPFEASDGFRLTLAGQDESKTTLEFFATRDRTYTIQASTDLRTWSPVQFRVLSGQTPGPLQGNFLATDATLVRIEVPRSGGEANRYFKAMIQ